MNNPSSISVEKTAHQQHIVHRTSTFWLQGVELLVICLAAYGLLIPSLGFYWDDWPAIVLAKTRSLSAFWDYCSFDRPLSAWTYIVGTWLLGTKPANWHIFTLLMRWLTVFIFLGLLDQIWPANKKINFWTAALLAVYPAFNLQPIALTFSQHFITSTFFMLSLVLMTYAIRRSAFRVWLIIAALIFQILHMVTVEYFIGLELLRPVIIFLLLVKGHSDWKKRVKEVMIQWLPYFLALSAFTFWRLFIYQVEIDPNAPRLIFSLQSDLSGTLIGLLNTSVRDFFYVVFLSWQNTMPLESFVFNDRFTLFSWGTAVLLFSALLILHRRDQRHKNIQPTISGDAARLWIGAYAILVGFLPAWFTGRDVFSGLYGMRFALPAIIGASIFLVGLIQILLRTEQQKLVLFCLLVSLSVSYHLRNANIFRLDWQAQRAYYWQLFWRAPGLESGTSIFTNGTVSKYVGNYSSASAINTLYAQPGQGQQDHWVFEYGRDFLLDHIDAYLNGTTMQGSMRSLNYTGSSQDVLVVVKPVDYCLWLLTPQLKNVKGISTSYRQFYSLTNLDVIRQASDLPPDEGIFGSEPAQDWCYFYQKIELVSQQQDWETVISLWQQAQELGYMPKNRFELISVINAYARLGMWQPAQQLTVEGSRLQFSVKDAYCDLWAVLETDTANSLKKEENLLLVEKRLGCE